CRCECRPCPQGLRVERRQNCNRNFDLRKVNRISNEYENKLVRDTQGDSGVKNKMGQRHLFRVILRFSIALLGLIGCYRLIQDSAHAGASRLFSFTAIIQSRLDAADLAVRLAPSDPEAHYTRALALVNSDRLSDAVAEFQQATRLRPHHYYEWLD